MEPKTSKPTKKQQHVTDSQKHLFELINDAFSGEKMGENRIGKISFVIISEQSKEQCK